METKYTNKMVAEPRALKMLREIAKAGKGKGKGKGKEKKKNGGTAKAVQS